LKISDIEVLARFLTKTDSTIFTAAQLLILENKYYEEIVGRLVTETGASKWPFGDFNYTAFPSFTVNMTNSIAEYDLRDWGTTDDATILTILGAEVKDNAGNWHPLKRVTLKDIHKDETGQEDYYKTDGLPYEYELRDNMLVLYPAPDNGVTVTLTAGLKLFFLRTADKFTSAEQTTGTKEPGFPSPWHDLLAYGMAYDYAIANGLPNANHLKAEYDRRIDEMLRFVANRDQAIDHRITTKKRIFR